TPYSIPTGTTIANLNRTPTATIENGSVTFILARDFTGALTNDLDTNNDGTLDVTPWSAVVDNIGWAEDSVVTASDIVYLGAAIGNAGIPPGTIDAASRSFTDLTPGSAGAWFNSDIIDDDLDLIYFPDRLSGTPTTDRLTPGSANVPEPTSAALLAVGSILLRRRRA
ncbi:MAG TPA: PEP-CTERM sorting domain-containing protein, partial [Tepidisphaeraceae bacterium]|nr:PEP-CTERM sorting domain-containing protein [Tepidisphaeraceae bacterium]